MNKANPRSKCLVCRLVNQMDEIRKHPNGAGLRGIGSKLAQIREYTDMEQWCEEHLKYYRDVSLTVEHWAARLRHQLDRPRLYPNSRKKEATNAQPTKTRHRL